MKKYMERTEEDKGRARRGIYKKDMKKIREDRKKIRVGQEEDKGRTGRR
jgi:hypothetical protein